MNENEKGFILAEKCVIGALLIDGDRISEICDILAPEMFCNRVLGYIYEECLNSYRGNKEFDIVTLANHLKESNFGYDDQEAFGIIKECMDSVYTSEYIKTHADIVIDNYIPRLCESRMKEIRNHPELAKQMIADLNRKVVDITESDGEDVINIPTMVEKYKGAHFCEREGKKLSTGVKPLDEIVGDLEGGDVVVIGARPAVGKSAFALQIINGMASDGNKIGYFNLEMTEKQVFERMVASESGIGLTRIRRAVKFLNDEEEKYNKACEVLNDRNRIYVSTGSKTVDKIRAIVDRENFDAIVVDYLQLVRPAGVYKNNRQAEVGYISHRLKDIAVDFEIPVILLSQINREVEKTSSKKPKMSEMRESGDIENDASIIVMLWNKDENDHSKKGFSVEKNRQGILGEGVLTFNGDLMKFYGEDDFIDASQSVVDEFEIPFWGDGQGGN